MGSTGTPGGGPLAAVLMGCILPRMPHPWPLLEAGLRPRPPAAEPSPCLDCEGARGLPLARPPQTSGCLLLREVRSPATPLAFLTQVRLDVASPPALRAGTASAGRGWYAYTRAHTTLPGRCEPLQGRHAGEHLFPPAVLTSALRSHGCPLPGGWGLSFHLGQNSTPWSKLDIPVVDSKITDPGC